MLYNCKVTISATLCTDFATSRELAQKWDTEGASKVGFCIAGDMGGGRREMAEIRVKMAIIVVRYFKVLVW